ncbi:MAG: hypothetical protein OHK0029_35100 [Armatimonadaceae bacterium]
MSNRQGKQNGFRNPHNLPTKVCPVCQRPFVWRKKWERDWEQVVYCSDACRRGSRSVANKPTESA